MNKSKYWILLVLISGLGLVLRLNNYDQVPPWREADDEIHYAWAGLTWLREGTPKSWSYLSSYPTFETYLAWDTKWRLVSPMLEKPPVYILLNGVLLVLTGVKNLDQVRLSVIRLLPIIFSLITIYLIGLVGKKVFRPAIGLLAALFYALTPIVVLSNRLSVTENLLTPIFLVATLVFVHESKSKHSSSYQPWLLGILAGLAALTKQSGIALAVALGCLFAYQREWQKLWRFGLTAFGLNLIYPAIGWYYNWPLFSSLVAEQRRIGLQGGLPQLILTILSRPLIGSEHLFVDGTLLLGYLLFFTSPYWLLTLKTKTENWKRIGLLTIPFTYIIYLALATTGAEPMGSGQGFWGWYMYPLFPYLTVLIAVILYDIWQAFSLFKFLPLFLLLGSSAVRFSLLFLPQSLHYRWQMSLGLLLVLVLALWQLPKYRKIMLTLLFLLFLAVNIFTSIHLDQIYPSLAQPTP
ncbi:MAG: Glycosyl transferase family 39 [Candidatus Gottesmanbacteria bacterium GW2011_GWB1_43_11]|uniref:Glycosyl transferase family 39 n=1 Tax=Candidatus Gottesmanbacteria bacterium GW2011_GWB1_43_11 TaxID=1618446 RepID=A0A0G1CKX7_9BACT|nr:MAG: Glycosyl transferase family 39 [Candidatus Gottesmanbacteria bacterium GW2011_GWA1_42_26]KKS81356.1 MAG: Glycosyl transferase family 39 [Candidatus Gottesmanbacteria bacterium GW2011_GWC1_43_10]KKS86475.1 MAG: Glycosyl transferase family 39 [Candidatus Gottesmanbacteria bacterium GW2011_GWB1_43_11]OGG07640.1 MAG: hypothetical protein A2699_06115 [Candidatus Gottesmanbacteria bacterium RIFCSPHIGHO2_01_FULL_43_15]HCM38297.1 hypothetical protein [Patescibacteria group bacterium]